MGGRSTEGARGCNLQDLNVACLMSRVMWTRTTPPKPQRQSSPKHRLTSHVQPAIGHHSPSVRPCVSQLDICVRRGQACHALEPRNDSRDAAHGGIACAEAQVWPQLHVGWHGRARHRPIADFCARVEIRRRCDAGSDRCWCGWCPVGAAISSFGRGQDVCQRSEVSSQVGNICGRKRVLSKWTTSPQRKPTASRVAPPHVSATSRHAVSFRIVPASSPTMRRNTETARPASGPRRTVTSSGPSTSSTARSKQVFPCADASTESVLSENWKLGKRAIEDVSEYT